MQAEKGDDIGNEKADAKLNDGKSGGDKRANNLLPRLRFISEEEANNLNRERNAELVRQKQLKVLLNLRPGAFEPEDQAEAAIHQNNIKKVMYWVGFAFFGASCTRFWQIKTGNTRILFGMTGLVVSYAPALIYYNIQQTKYTEFVRGLSERYRARIRDEHLD